MATYSFVSIISADNDANFRIWGKAVSDALQAVGGIAKLSAVDSSGQINWATVTKPGANLSAGYEMYKFADTLQSTVPVFIKIEWGSGAAGNSVSMWVTVGFAHDGAGTLTGFTSTRFRHIHTYNHAVTVTATSHISASTSRLQYLLRVGNSTTNVNEAFSLSVERTHAANGSDTNYGVIILFGYGPLFWYSQLLSFVAGVIATEGPTNVSVLAPSVGHGSAGGTTAIYPCWVVAGPYFCPFAGFVFAFSGNITSGVPFSVTLLGAAKTFMPRTQTNETGMTARGVTLVQCVRWE